MLKMSNICSGIFNSIFYVCRFPILFGRYKFSWQPSRDRWPRWSGVKQGDEVQFIFGDPLDHPADYLIEEKEFSKQMMKYWANFARTG